MHVNRSTKSTSISVSQSLYEDLVTKSVYYEPNSVLVLEGSSFHEQLKCRGHASYNLQLSKVKSKKKIGVTGVRTEVIGIAKRVAN